jgi:predicted GIY-YIG superfamily endonuclease
MVRPRTPTQTARSHAPPASTSASEPKTSAGAGHAGDTNPWVVYVLWSASLERTYVGIAQDVERRLRQHNGELVRGARATRAGRPWDLRIAFGPYADRSAAQIAEAEVKRLSGVERFAYHAPVWAQPPSDSEAL